MQTQETECAQRIKQELKSHFPYIKFSIKSSKGNVKISYDNHGMLIGNQIRILMESSFKNKYKDIDIKWT